MPSKRPGTVDYSKWDHFECSDSESDEDDGDGGGASPFSSCLQHGVEEGSDDDPDYESGEFESDDGSRCTASEHSESDDGSEDSVSEDSDSDDSLAVATPGRRTTVAPAPTLEALQRAWHTNTEALLRPCANCFSQNAPFRCHRCRLVRYCHDRCQRAYHPIHKLECIDAEKHASYWGMFDGNKNDRGGGASVDNLKARRSTKRRRALQRAAARAQVERAARAREARGAPAKGGGKGKCAEEREEECCICLCDFTVQGDGGVPFCCPASHYMCQECSGVWVNSVMGNLEETYPPKCPQCKVGISKETFVRQLTSAQQNTFRAHAARTALKPWEKLIECKECCLFEVVSDDPVLWWCPHCECGTCRVCNKDLPPGAVKYDIEKSSHRVCKELRKPKALIEEAIEEGSNMRCSSCKLAGRKDDACTHMTCTKCSTEWCYVCGLSVRQCDKAPPLPGRHANDIYLHNKDWEVNEKRCPMYLTQILEVDLNWLGENWEENARDEDFEDDERCLDYLHRFKTIKLLQGVLEKVGKKAFIGTFIAFDSIKNCGYTYNEIISTSTDKLIDRSDFLQNQESPEENHVDNNALGHPEAALPLRAMPPGFNGVLDALVVDPDELDQRLLTEAIQRSEDSAAEDNQIREALARSAGQR